MINGENINTERYYNYINNLINIRGQGGIPDEDYFEIHHIIPKCCGGEPNKQKKRSFKHPNLIWLYPKEHFIAHKILAEDNPDYAELTYACGVMTHILDDIELSADEYEKLKIKFSEFRKNFKYSNEAKCKMSIAKKGRIWSDEQKKNLYGPRLKGRHQKKKRKINNKFKGWCENKIELHNKNVNNGCGSHANDWHKKAVYCIEEDITFEYLKDACNGFSNISGYSFNSLKWMIRDNCNNKRDNVAGYHFEWR